MALLLSLSEYKAFAGISSTDSTRDAALSSILSGVDAEIRKVCKPVLFESVAISGKAGVVDAPPDRILIPPWRPIYSAGLLVYRNPDANGDPTAFTSAHLLTLYTDYDLLTDDTGGTYSLRGAIRFINGLWGGTTERPAQSLAGRLVPTRGAVKLVGTFGFTSVPEEIKRAAALATSLLYNRRKTGTPVTSEAWNSYSYSTSGPFTASAAIHTPDVWAILSRYGAGGIVIAGGNT